MAAPAAAPPATQGTRAAPRTPAVLAGLLVLLVLALQVPEAWGALPVAHCWPALPAGLLLPGLLHAAPGPVLPLLAAQRPPGSAHLALAALRVAPPAGHPPSRAGVTIGFLPLLLAILGLCRARGRLAGAGRVALGVALALFAHAAWRSTHGEAPGPLGQTLLLAALGLLAGAGLGHLRPRAPDSRGEAGAIALAAAAVGLAATLAGLALSAGAATDAEVTAPLHDRVTAPPERTVLAAPAVAAVNAAWLRGVLDRAALAAFVSMSVLLLHLRSRSPVTGALLLVTVAADLLSIRLLL